VKVYISCCKIFKGLTFFWTQCIGGPWDGCVAGPLEHGQPRIG